MDLRIMEHVTIRIDNDDPSPAELRGYFAEVLASLDGNPRELLVSVHTANDRGAAASIEFSEGEPVFCIEGRTPAKAEYRKRWIAEHPVPLKLRPHGTLLVFAAKDGGRVVVRRPTLAERLFG